MNSCRKGKRGELEGRDKIIEMFGCEARRGQQHAGGQDSPDVVHNIPGLHFEIKRCEKLLLYPAIEQAAKDAGENVPIVLHRRNHKPWLVIVYADDIERLRQVLNDWRIEQYKKGGE